ncbi:MAG TPA: hypothetical protein VK348_01575, partial [Planctomycetota bacterium]|nr:hypothetical protein [Planctomycetota bacterium]
MNSSRLPFVLVLALALPLAAQGIATSSRPVEDVLPASSYGCLRFGGLAAGAQGADQLAISALVREILGKLPAATREEHIDRGIAMAAQAVSAKLQQIGLTPTVMRAVLSRPMALGLGHLSLDAMGPSVALVIDCGDAAASVDKLWAAVEQLPAAQLAPGTRLAPPLANFHAGTGEVGGLAVRTLVRDDGPVVMAAHVDGWFVVTNSKAYLQDIRATVAGKQQSLAAASALGKLRSRLAAPALASLFVNARPFNNVFDSVLPYEA